MQAAHAAVKFKESSYYRLKYENISKRRGKKRAIIAITRMILTAIYSMVSTYESGYAGIPQGKNDFQSKTKHATKFLQNQGLTVL